jgi:hypothetical protein
VVTVHSALDNSQTIRENVNMRTRNLLLLVCLACAPAWADAVTIALDLSLINASPGQQVTFSGVIINNELAPVDLNGISITLNGMFTVDTTPFFLGPPTVAASAPSAPSQTSDFALFNVLVDLPYTDPLGVKSGILTILGGIEGVNGYDPSVQDFLGSTTFSVNVGTVPEPSCLTLILTGAALVFVYRALIRANRWNSGGSD